MQPANLFRGMVCFLALAGAAQAQPDFSEGLTGLGNGAADTSRQEGWEARNRAAEAAAEAALKNPGATRADTTTGATIPSGGYTLGGGDKVRMTVFGEDDLTGEYDVDGTGIMALPLVGNVNVLGKTLREAEDIITQKYGSGYLVMPRVSLEVLNFRPFFILGEVNKPGSYPYVNDLTVINAVALAGGYTPRAKTGKVYIRRADDPKRQEVEALEDAKVFPGDAIRVDERFF